jgi:peptidoglycan/LPS O-acetylase OafA/YrhL
MSTIKSRIEGVWDLRSIPNDLPELTSLRAFAALIVVLFHMFFDESSVNTVFDFLISDGHLGVDLFFILSGFILAHTNFRKWRDGQFSHRDFLINRFARVYPLHLFMILLFLLAYQARLAIGVTTEAIGQNWDHLPYHIFLLHAWGFTDGHSWNFPSWSVSAEAFAYLFFALAFGFLVQFRPLMALAIGLAAFWTCHLIAEMFGFTLTKMMYNFGILRIAGEFLLGIGLYQFFRSRSLHESLVKPLLILFLFGIVFGAYLQINESLIVMLFGGMIFLVANLATLDRPSVMRNSTLIYLGEISYSTYMVHILVLMVLDLVLRKLEPEPFIASIFYAVSLVAIYAASALLYHFVERPCRRAIRSIKPRHKDMIH